MNIQVLKVMPLVEGKERYKHFNRDCSQLLLQAPQILRQVIQILKTDSQSPYRERSRLE